VFQPGKGLSMYLSPATLDLADPGAQPRQYEVAIRPGTDPMLTILIMVVAGLGVLNTVALQIRERTCDIGVFKAIGMTPRQTLAMIVCSVAFTGLVAGIIAVPVGVYLHHGVVPVMAHAANSGYPPSMISVYSPWEVVLLALVGLVIAVAGALGPAGWAARTRMAFALRAE
jgi:putative ABC transport system permease protein